MTDKAKGWIYVVVQFLLLGIILFSSAIEFKYLNRPLTPVVHYIGVTFILLGTLCFMVVIINLDQAITPNPVPRDKAILRTGGVYKFIRHPMYFSILVIFFGVILYFQAYCSFLWLLGALVFFIAKSKQEEKYLINKFPEYSIYKLSSKRIIPFIY